LLTYTGVPAEEPPPPPEPKPPPEALDPPPQDKSAKEEISSIVARRVGLFIINFLHRLIPKSAVYFESIRRHIRGSALSGIDWG
jgi:hypothetical protein